MPQVLFDTTRAARVPFMPAAGAEVGLCSWGTAHQGCSPLTELRQYVVLDVLKRRLAVRGHSLRHTLILPVAERSAASSETLRAFWRDLALLDVRPPSLATSSDVEPVLRPMTVRPAHAIYADAEWTVPHGLQIEPVVDPQRQPAVTTLEDVLTRGFAPRVCRLLFLGSHYRNKLVFDWPTFASTAAAYDRLAQLVADQGAQTEAESAGFTPNGSALGPFRRPAASPALVTRLKHAFDRALDEDLQTPRALSTLWEALKHPLLHARDKLEVALHVDAVLGLDLLEAGALLRARKTPATLTSPVMQLIERRNEARNNRDFARADALRVELQRLGFLVEDHAQGTRVSVRGLTAPVIQAAS